MKTIEDRLDRIVELLVLLLAAVLGKAVIVQPPAEPTPDEPVEPEEEEDPLAETPKKLTQTDVQDAVRDTVKRLGKTDENIAKIVATLEKYGGKRASEVKEADYGKAIAALSKLKK